MLNSFIDEVKKQVQIEFKYASERMINDQLISLFVLKYYCDNGKYSYQELMMTDEMKDVLFPIDGIQDKIYSTKCTKLLALIQYANLKELIKEYISDRNIEINSISRNEKKICVATELEKKTYDITGNTIYIVDKFNVSNYQIAIYKFLDKVLGVNNKYLKYEEALKEEYDTVYIYDNMPRYRFIKNSNNDVYLFIRTILNCQSNKKVILHTDFKKISNMKEARYLVAHLSKVILYDDKNTLVYFEKKANQQVSIIDYNRDKIKSIEQLNKIIEHDRKRKDVLVKTTVQDIKNNYYRIGFKLYQNNVVESVRNINEIVDENTSLINQLSSINKDIEQEINRLINR